MVSRKRTIGRAAARPAAASAVWCVVAAIAAAQSYTFNNSITEVRFTGAAGKEVELDYVKDLASGRTINFLTYGTHGITENNAGATVGLYNGDIAFLLRDRVNPYSTSTSQVRWFTVGDILANLAPGPWSVSVPGPVTLASGAIKYTITYTATNLVFDGNTFNASVYVEWRLEPGTKYLLGQAAVIIPGMGKTATQPGLNFYLSAFKFPRLHVRHVGPSTDPHALLFSSDAGELLEDPVAPTTVFPSFFRGTGDGALFIAKYSELPMLAYYDATTRDCLYFSDDDLLDWWRDYEAERLTDAAGAHYLELRCRHQPDDIYAKDSFTTLYRMRVAAIQGDWVGAADEYRGFLASSAPWYKGPVGARTDVSAAIKNAPFHHKIASLLRTDNVDEMAQDALNFDRVIGGGSFIVWTGGFAPDNFDDFYYNGYLPGRPSFAAAVRAAEKGGRAVVAPYLNTLGGVDYLNSSLASTHDSLVTRNQFLVREDGQLQVVGPGLGDYWGGAVCQGDTSATPTGWRTLFEGTATAILDHVRSRALYLDTFNTAPCFSDAASHGGHKPGGGHYMFDGRRTQLQEIRNTAATNGLPFLGYVMEGEQLGYVGEIDVMHNSPLLLTFTWDHDSNPATPQVAIPQLKSIPLFRTVADAVRLSQFQEHSKGDGVGKRGWLNAMDVFAFGHVPHLQQDAVDLLRSGPEEIERLYLQSADYERYLRRVVKFLRDPSSNFLFFHNGTLRRQPGYTVGNVGTFSATLDEGPGFNAPFVQKYLVAGLYQAPFALTTPLKQACLAVTNPWVGGGAPSFTFDNVTVNPADWGPPTGTTYTVTQYDDAGAVTGTWTLPAATPFTISGTGPAIAPGEIWRWVFTG